MFIKLSQSKLVGISYGIDQSVDKLYFIYGEMH